MEAVILPCTGVGWREDVLRFNRRESINNFVKKELDADLANDHQGIIVILGISVIFNKCIQTLKLFCLPLTSVMNERSFSHMKLVKSKRCGKLSEKALNDLMMVRLETPGVPKFDPLPSIKTWQMTSSNQPRRVDNQCHPYI